MNSLRLDPPYVPLIQKPDCCAMACLQMILYRHGCGLYDQEALAVRFGVKIEPHVAGAFAEGMPIITQPGVDEGISTVESEGLVNAFFREESLCLEAASFRYSACASLTEFIEGHLRQNHDLWVEYHGCEIHPDDEYKGRYFHDGLIESFDGERVIVVNPKPTHRQRFPFPLPLLARAISGVHGRETGFVVVRRRA